MAKIQAFDYPLLGFFVRHTGAFPVRRGEGDRRALVTALRVLAGGQILGFFPEGHRSESGALLLRGKPGVGFLASRAGERPDRADRDDRNEAIGCSASSSAGMPSYAWDGHFTSPSCTEDERHDEQAVTDAVMRRIAALLPSEMRGAYP